MAAHGAAGLGARVVLVEKREQTGGDCLWTGCVPSKSSDRGGGPRAPDANRGCSWPRARRAAREDPAVGALVLDVLQENGIDVRLGAHAVCVTRDEPGRVVHLEDGETVSGCELLIATGRAPRVADLGLETLGVEVDAAGLAVDERCRVTDGVWAVGDVTGVLAFTHVGMYQARIAAQDIAGKPARADYRAIPRVAFCNPEVVAVGLTEPKPASRAWTPPPPTSSWPTRSRGPGPTRRTQAVSSG